MKLFSNLELSTNKIIAFFSFLISIDLIVISHLLIPANPKPEEKLIVQKKPRPVRPKMGFAEIIARGVIVPQVLSEQTVFTPPLKSVILTKKEYVIAAIGDSMIETMGNSLDYLQRDLENRYPGTKFTMYNYGIGGEKVTGGLWRLNKPYDLGSRHFPPLSELRPDILIVGSYAYNPFDIPNPTVHRNQLAELVNQARQISGKVYMIAEIAPLKDGFGTGPGGVNWPEALADEQTAEIENQMQNVFGIAKTLTVPVIDIYNKSKVFGSNYGNTKYVSSHDNIHPSVEGESFMARVIVDSLNLK